jgi:hypothetical protein
MKCALQLHTTWSKNQVQTVMMREKVRRYGLGVGLKQNGAMAWRQQMAW